MWERGCSQAMAHMSFQVEGHQPLLTPANGKAGAQPEFVFKSVDLYLSVKLFIHNPKQGQLPISHSGKCTKYNCTEYQFY